MVLSLVSEAANENRLSVIDMKSRRSNPGPEILHVQYGISNVSGAANFRLDSFIEMGEWESQGGIWRETGGISQPSGPALDSSVL